MGATTPSSKMAIESIPSSNVQATSPTAVTANRTVNVNTNVSTNVSTIGSTALTRTTTNMPAVSTTSNTSDLKGPGGTEKFTYSRSEIIQTAHRLKIPH